MIENIAQKLVQFLPRYGATLWAILSAPVSQVQALAPRPTETVPAVTFWSASIGLYILTRFLMFERLPNAFGYVAAIGLSSGVHLIGAALGVSLAARLFGAPLAVATSLTAIAYVWGALIPVQSVMMILIFGLFRVLDAELFVTVANILNGCRRVVTPDALAAQVQDSLAAAGSLGFWAIGIAGLLFLFLNAVWFVYAVAFLRALRRISGASGPRFGLIALLGFGLMLLAGLIGSGIYLVLLADSGACLPPATS